MKALVYFAAAPLLLILAAGQTFAEEMKPFSPVLVPADVRLSYDRMNDATIAQLKPQFAYRDKSRLSAVFELKIFAIFTCRGDTLTAPDSVTIVIAHGAQVRQGVSAEAADWWFSLDDAHALRVLIDGERHELGSMICRRGAQASSLIGERGISWRPGLSESPEMLLLTMSADMAIRVFGATATEGQVDGLRFYLHQKAGGIADNFREFAVFIRDLKVMSP